MKMTLVELVACLGVLFGFGAAAIGFGSVAVLAYQSLLPERPRIGALRTPGAARVPESAPRQVTFLEPHPSARCPVCRDGIQGQVRMCPRCRVLSHDDCWEFQGGCAIFGCCERAQG